MEHNKNQQTPEGWTPTVWHAFSEKLEDMSKEELIKAFEDLGLVFEDVDTLDEEEIISVADVLSEADVKAYFKI